MILVDLLWTFKGQGMSLRMKGSLALTRWESSQIAITWKDQTIMPLSRTDSSGSWTRQQKSRAHFISHRARWGLVSTFLSVSNHSISTTVPLRPHRVMGLTKMPRLCLLVLMQFLWHSFYQSKEESLRFQHLESQITLHTSNLRICLVSNHLRNYKKLLQTFKILLNRKLLSIKVDKLEIFWNQYLLI